MAITSPTTSRLNSDLLGWKRSDKDGFDDKLGKDSGAAAMFPMFINKTKITDAIVISDAGFFNILHMLRSLRFPCCRLSFKPRSSSSLDNVGG
mmetsp:Transcript_14586/g.40537  ORF Transcript_14586/g.40537 Transcript_14586/m.40537 type:complete len:93 (+) Transcript_14586:855-1133(+)